MPPSEWSAREAVEALLLWIFLAVAAATLLLRLGWLSREGTSTGVVVVLPSLIAGLGAVAWARAARPASSRLGWGFGHPWRDLGLGLAAAGLFAPALALLQHWLQRTVGPIHHPLTPILAGAVEPGDRLALSAIACLAIPALEETIFRGLLYRGLRRSWTMWPAALGSGVVFAIGHGSWTGALPYLILGVVLAWLYERTGSLLAPAVAHGASNAFNLALLLALYG